MPLLENQNNGMDVFLVTCRICHAPRQALFRAGDATGCGQLYRIIAPVSYTHLKLFEIYNHFHYNKKITPYNLTIFINKNAFNFLLDFFNAIL